MKVFLSLLLVFTLAAVARWIQKMPHADRQKALSWLKARWWWGPAVIAVIIAGLLVPWASLMPTSGEAPTVGTVGLVLRKYWLWLLFALVAAYGLAGGLLPEEWKKVAMPLLHFMAALFVVSVLWSWATSPSKPQFEWMSVTIPAKGRTPGLISVPPGHMIVTEGFGQLVNVYPGNQKDVECWARSSSCPATGAVKGAYIVNEGNSPITVRYTFE